MFIPCSSLLKHFLLKYFCCFIFISCTDSQYSMHTNLKNKLANKADLYKLFKAVMTELQRSF